MDYIEEKIQKIKDKKLFGNLIEVGCGCPIYSQLCNYPNTASKIVNWTFSPNNWEWNNEHYNHGNSRAISHNVAYNFINNEALSENINFVLTNTIQISNTPDIQTHGWFALYTLTNIKLYHFTINGFRSRKEYIELISEIGLDILSAYNNIEELDNGYIDIIMDEVVKNHNISLEQNLKETLTVIKNGKLNIDHIHNTSIVIRKNGQIDRFNDLLREHKNLLICKGSFNPLHPQHLELIKYSTISNSKPIFCISIYNRDVNKQVDINSLLKRINIINDLGYDVIIDCLGTYHYSYTYIINNCDYNNHKIIYVLGYDTIGRLLNDENVIINSSINEESISKWNNKWSKCDFFYIDRPGYKYNISSKLFNVKLLNIKESQISSTDIRKLLEQKDFTNLEKLVGKQLTELYKKYE